MKWDSLVILTLVCLLALLVGCGDKQSPEEGDPELGRELARTAGCGSCHRIPGVGLAQGQVGPPLDKIARRAYLAGILPNTFENMVLWLEKPQEVAPGSGMPDTGITHREAEHISAYLYTLD